MKLKLISFVFIAIFLAISVQNIFIVPQMESYIKKKAFEISTTTIERISDFSSFALLERTYENRLSLDDAIKKVQNSNIDGLIGVSIYQRGKDNDDIKFEYISGFGERVKKIELDNGLLKSLKSCRDEDVSYDSYIVNTKNQKIDTYRFVRPIVYKYHGDIVLLGVSILYYDKKAINEIVEKMIDFMSTITIIVLLIATLFVYFISVRFTRPILEITKAATSIGKGDLNVHLDIQTNDEIEHLAYHFNLMVDGLKEKKKMKKFVSNSTMNMIQEDSTKEMILGGEHRTLTFIFCDIRNFTAMSEQLKPSDVVNIVNFYLNLQAQIIIDNGGDIDKYIGDEIMASFSGKDATYRAIKSAIEIQTLIAEENIKRVQNKEVVCEVGIGIKRGEVIVGNIGSHEHMDFTAVGLAVNVASRLCSTALSGEIIIERKTFEAANYKYDARLQTPFLIKGISYPIDTYSLSVKSL